MLLDKLADKVEAFAGNGRLETQEHKKFTSLKTGVLP